MRILILLAAMREGGLIRFRGHGACVTFETTLAIGTALQAAARFMEAHLGPFTQVCVNQLPVGPSAGIAYRDLKPLLEANDFSSILPELAWQQPEGIWQPCPLTTHGLAAPAHRFQGG